MVAAARQTTTDAAVTAGAVRDIVMEGINLHLAPIQNALQELQTTIAAQQTALETLKLAHPADLLDKLMKGHEEMHSLSLKSTLEITNAMDKAEQALQDVNCFEHAGRPSPTGPKRRGLDAKHLAPDSLGDVYRLRWRNWSGHARRYLQTVDRDPDKKLPTLPKELETQSTKVTSEQITKANLHDETVGEIEQFLSMKLEGTPCEAIIIGMEGQHVLEQWRALAEICRPVGFARHGTRE